MALAVAHIVKVIKLLARDKEDHGRIPMEYPSFIDLSIIHDCLLSEDSLTEARFGVNLLDSPIDIAISRYFKPWFR